MELDLKQKRRMLDDGYVVIAGVVSRDLIDEALREINHRLGLRYQTLDADAAARDSWSDDVDAPAIMDLLHKSPLWELAQSLSGGGRLDGPATGRIVLRFPAVNDSHGGLASRSDGFSAPNANKMIGCFTMLIGILLSDAPDKHMGNLTVYPGTHRPSARRTEAAQITGKAGDIVLCHCRLAHGEERNLSHTIGYMAYWRLRHKDAGS